MRVLGLQATPLTRSQSSCTLQGAPGAPLRVQVPCAQIGRRGAGSAGRAQQTGGADASIGTGLPDAGWSSAAAAGALRCAQIAEPALALIVADAAGAQRVVAGRLAGGGHPAFEEIVAAERSQGGQTGLDRAAGEVRARQLGVAAQQTEALLGDGQGAIEQLHHQGRAAVQGDDVCIRVGGAGLGGGLGAAAGIGRVGARTIAAGVVAVGLFGGTVVRCRGRAAVGTTGVGARSQRIGIGVTGRRQADQRRNPLLAAHLEMAPECQDRAWFRSQEVKADTQPPR
jgi:hypothetical protein